MLGILRDVRMKKEKNKSPQEISFRSSDFFRLKNDNVSMKISWIFSPSTISMMYFFHMYICTCTCILIKNCPNVTVQNLGQNIGVPSLLWEKVRHAVDFQYNKYNLKLDCFLFHFHAYNIMILSWNNFSVSNIYALKWKKRT